MLIRKIFLLCSTVVVLATPLFAGATQPDLLPNSHKLAFSRGDSHGYWEVYATKVNGTGQINLTNNPLNDLSPAWSPDGDKIAFTSDRGGYPGDVYIMNANGANQINLTHDLGVDVQILDPVAWSPAGDKIVFSDVYGVIWVVSEDGSDPTPIATGEFGGWSSDGGKITFVVDVDEPLHREIHTINPDGTNEINLTPEGSDDWEPSWSPDGGQIAFVSQFTEGPADYGVYVMNMDGSDRTSLDAVGAWPAWSPNGGMIAYAWTSDLSWDVYVMNADGTAQTNLTNNPDYTHATWPVWAPKGNKIAFTVSSGSGAFLSQVCAINSDGTHYEVIADEGAAYPVWRP